MQVFHYDPIDKYFTGASTANTSPLEPDKKLIPAYATSIDPPEYGAGQIPVWNGNAWSLAEDNRGQKYYDVNTGEEITINTIGPLPDCLTSEPRPGNAYKWDGLAWVYDISLDSPGRDYSFNETAKRWFKTRFTRKEFMLFVGVPQIAKLNAAINSGNALAKTVHDLLMAAEFIDVTDPATHQMLAMLAIEGGGLVLTDEEVLRVMAGVPHEN